MIGLLCSVRSVSVGPTVPAMICLLIGHSLSLLSVLVVVPLLVVPNVLSRVQREG